MLTRKSNYS